MSTTLRVRTDTRHGRAGLGDSLGVVPRTANAHCLFAKVAFQASQRSFAAHALGSGYCFPKNSIGVLRGRYLQSIDFHIGKRREFLPVSWIAWNILEACLRHLQLYV